MAKHHDYPKWKYHAKEGGKVVQNEDEEKELGKSWRDEPRDPEKVEQARIEAEESAREHREAREAESKQNQGPTTFTPPHLANPRTPKFGGDHAKAVTPVTKGAAEINADPPHVPEGDKRALEAGVDPITTKTGLKG